MGRRWCILGLTLVLGLMVATHGLAAPSHPCQASPPGRSPGVAVDREHCRAQVTVVRPGGKLVISLDPLTSLTLHTLNVYDLLGLHGRGYALKSDPKVQQAVDPVIYGAIAGKENYFALVTDGRDFYQPTMDRMLAHASYAQYPDPQLLSALAPDPFNRALVRMWREFYQSYWNTHFETLLREFEQMDQQMRWGETLGRMEQLAGRPWRGTMFVFAVEGTADSALTYGANVCIGTLGVGDDAGFVHEGLHLLLKKEWSRSPRLQQFMAGREFDDPFWRQDWAGKYEQALVLLLEYHVRHVQSTGKGAELTLLRRSFEGCGVGDLFDVAWPLVSDYVREGGSLNDLMWEMVTRGEAERAKQRSHDTAASPKPAR